MSKANEVVVKMLKEVKIERKVNMCVPLPQSDTDHMTKLAESHPNLTKTEIARMAVRFALYNDDFLTALKKL
ncbi:MAG: hypothetical protein KAR06_01390 [Deltaproteobacteria bacterium]|nr:hypothetical protein [Deltaproteobacteria bacterium]